jgi:hypothetical protein
MVVWLCLMVASIMLEPSGTSQAHNIALCPGTIIRAFARHIIVSQIECN